jgi:CBS domain-containing protein
MAAQEPRGGGDWRLNMLHPRRWSMKVGEICSRDVLAMSASEPLAECAREMKDRNVGSVVIVETSRGFARPIGIVTDRDLLRGQFDRSADLFCLDAGDVMTGDPLVLNENAEVSDALERMSRKSVRRAPVVDGSGELVGIVTFDDLLPVIAGQMSAIGGLISEQVERRRLRR